jgi:hypothetical protein
MSNMTFSDGFPELRPGIVKKWYHTSSNYC